MPSFHLQSKLLFACILLALAAPFATSASAAEFMFQATVDGETFEGRPLAWTDDVMHLLGRDGRRHTFDPSEAKDARKTSPVFYGYSVPEVKRELHREFGDAMDITATKHYVVVHPRGGQGKWAARFEDLYRSFWSYFRVRGFQLEEPKFPLVAVVYPTRDDYYKAVSKERNVPSGLLGHYDDFTNRVQLYDVTGGDSDEDWAATAETIIHEATHQTAFNVGIHNRFADQPRWLAEGLATMFEARGVWNSPAYNSLNDRINQSRLADFRAKLKVRKPGTLGNLIASDKMFQTDAAAAYAEAWALTLFLCETRPRELAAYLQKTASRPDFNESYFATERVNDFAQCFGSDFRKLEANFLSWIAQLQTLN